MLGTKKRLKIFTVGDVVKYDEFRLTPKETIRCKVKPDDRGVVIGISEGPDGYSYYIQWFQQIEDTLCTQHYRLTLCEGMKNPEICDKCRYRLECWTTRDKVITRTKPRLAKAII